MEPSLEQQSLTPIDLILVFSKLFLILDHEGSPAHCDATQNQTEERNSVEAKCPRNNILLQVRGT